MKITFIQKHMSVLSGWSEYQPGQRADLTHGKSLVSAGVAYEGWGSPPELEESIVLFDEMTLDELRKHAQIQGIKSYHRMKRETLINRLTNGNN